MRPTLLALGPRTTALFALGLGTIVLLALGEPFGVEVPTTTAQVEVACTVGPEAVKRPHCG